MTILHWLLGFAGGFLAGYFIARAKTARLFQKELTPLQTEVKTLSVDWERKIAEAKEFMDFIRSETKRMEEELKRYKQ